MTRILPIDPAAPDAAVLAEAVAVLRRGGLVAFPTETVYGLGADALSAAAVRGIFAAKGRPSYNPLIAHVADIAGAQALVTEWPPVAQALAERFWPGPLTLALPKRAAVPDEGRVPVWVRRYREPLHRPLRLARQRRRPR